MTRKPRGTDWYPPGGRAFVEGDPAINLPVDFEGREELKRRDARREARSGDETLILIPCRGKQCSKVAAVVLTRDGYVCVRVRGPFRLSGDGTYALTGDRSAGHGSMQFAIPDHDDEIIMTIICRRSHTNEIHSGPLRKAIAMAMIGRSSRAAE